MQKAYVKREYQGKSQLLNEAGYFENSNLHEAVVLNEKEARIIAGMLNHYATYAHYTIERVQED